MFFGRCCDQQAKPANKALSCENLIVIKPRSNRKLLAFEHCLIVSTGKTALLSFAKPKDSRPTG
jgi:hypothetical protein